MWSLICDYPRERPANLLHTNKQYKVYKKVIKTGDYQIRSPNGIYTHIIERKTIYDLIATLRDTKRASNHSKLLKFRDKHCAKIIYLIEFQNKKKCRQNVFKAADKKVRGFWDNVNLGHKLMITEFFKKIIGDDCKIIYTKNIRDTARKIDRFVKKQSVSSALNLFNELSDPCPLETFIHSDAYQKIETLNLNKNNMARTVSTQLIDTSDQMQSAQSSQSRRPGANSSQINLEPVKIDDILQEPTEFVEVDFKLLSRYNVAPNGLSYEQMLEVCEILRKLESTLRSYGKVIEFTPIQKSQLMSSVKSAPKLTHQLVEALSSPNLIDMDDELQDTKSEITSVSMLSHSAENTSTSKFSESTKKVMNFNDDEEFEQIRSNCLLCLKGVNKENLHIVSNINVYNLLCNSSLDELNDALGTRVAKLINQQDKKSIIKFLDEIPGVTSETATIIYESWSPFSRIYDASPNEIGSICKKNGQKIGKSLGYKIHKILTSWD